jgi:hypothetical protein
MLLIVTQILSPLIHGHGYGEPVRGFHLPGFEYLSRTVGEIDMTSANGFPDSGNGLIIGVASGIETKPSDTSDIDSRELLGFIALVLSSVFISESRLFQATFLIPEIRSGWTHHPSRAPPALQS